MAFDFIRQALEERRQAGLLRQRHCIGQSVGSLIEIAGQHFLNFSGNDYLGMRQSPDVMQAFVQGVSQYGVGSGASPLVTGFTAAHAALENYLAEGLGREAVLLFNSGFAANQAVCQTLLHKSSAIVADKLMHASFIDGALASDAPLKRFRHNDLAHLQQILDTLEPAQDILIATEGVFSMDGDSAPLGKMVEMSATHNAMLMVDDAHGMGVLGEQGLGSVEQLQLGQQHVPIVMGTFGKGIGTAGAFVAGSRELIDYLINFARHYVYSTAMPPAQAMATLASFQAIGQSKVRQQLFDNIDYFKHLAAQADLPLMPSDSAIQPLLMGDPVLAVEASKSLRRLGLWVTAIRTPTVPKGSDRLRITLSASHQQRDIQALVDGLSLVLAKISHGGAG